MSEIVDWFAAITAALGAWLFAIPFLLPQSVPMDGLAFWNYVLVGTAMAGLSAYTWWVGEDAPGRTLAAGVVTVLGAWTIAVPYLTTLRVNGWLLWNDAIVGSIVVVLGAYCTYEALEFDGGTISTPT